MAAYITRALLKDRLLARQIPLPHNGDADLDRIIEVASGMVRDRCTTFDETAPPAAVQQVTLVLSLRMRVNETMLGSDADGKPVQGPLWTQDLDDILGNLITREVTAPADNRALIVQRVYRAHPTTSEYRREADCAPWRVGWDW